MDDEVEELENDFDNILDGDDDDNLSCGWIYSPGSEECDWCEYAEECSLLAN
jgi:hypothetical protein